MPDNLIEFDATIRFKGSLEKFKKAAARLAEADFEVATSPWEPIPKPEPGGFPLPIHRILSRSVINDIVRGMPRIKLDGIRGGMRNPHLHVGKEAVILNRARFKKLVREVAAGLGERFAGTAQYTEAIDALRAMAPKR